MSHTTNLIKRIDWPLLREQKEYCTNEAANNADAARIYDGLLNLLDAIQDAAVKDGLASEVEVFGPEDERDE